MIERVSKPYTHAQIYKATEDTQPRTIVNLNHLGDKNERMPNLTWKTPKQTSSTMLYTTTGPEVRFGPMNSPGSPTTDSMPSRSSSGQTQVGCWCDPPHAR